MNVISSRNDKFTERHVEPEGYASSAFRSVKFRNVLFVTSPSNRHPRDVLFVPRIPVITGLSGSFHSQKLGKSTRRKGIKKASCRNGTRLLVLLCF